MKSNYKYLVEITEESAKYLLKYNKFKHLFIKDKSVSTLSKYQFWNYKISLKLSKKLIYRSIYSLSKKELKILREYLNENQKKRFI